MIIHTCIHTYMARWLYVTSHYCHCISGQMNEFHTNFKCWGKSKVTVCHCGKMCVSV